MEKRGIVDEHTPPERRGGEGGAPRGEKQAADAREAHATTRMADAARDAFSKPAPGRRAGDKG